jgi:hypothetical protein
VPEREHVTLLRGCCGSCDEPEEVFGRDNAAELYGEHNRVLFAEAYNNFVKMDGWFGSEVRDGIQNAEKGSACRDAGQTR